MINIIADNQRGAWRGGGRGGGGGSAGTGRGRVLGVKGSNLKGEFHALLGKVSQS